MFFFVINPPAQPPIFGKITAPAICTAGLLKNSLNDIAKLNIFSRKLKFMTKSEDIQKKTKPRKFYLLSRQIFNKH